MRHYLIAVLALVFCFSMSQAKDEKSDKKLKAAIDREELRFLKAKDKNPGDANIYWEHANKLSEFNTEYKRAQNYYIRALQLDSVRGDIYKDYGKYLFERLQLPGDAKSAWTKGLNYAANDEEMKKYLVTVNVALARREEETKLRDFGTTNVKEVNPDGNYSSTANFDSLNKVLTDGTSQKSYIKLLNRFLAEDASLTPGDMYLLIIGYAKDKDSSPFNYNDINLMTQLAAYNVDSAISKGIEIISTNPLNPTLNREMMYYYRKKNDQVNAEKYLTKVKQFFSGMLYSGNGSCERPYISLWAKEYGNFIGYLGYKYADNHSMGNCAGQMAEIVDITDPATGKTEKVHFNIRLIYQQTTGK